MTEFFILLSMLISMLTLTFSVALTMAWFHFFWLLKCRYDDTKDLFKKGKK